MKSVKLIVEGENAAMKYKFNTLGVISLVLLFLVSPASAFAATLSLNPATGTFNRGCSYTVKIDLDTSGKQTDGTDAIVKYTPTALTMNPVTNGTIYPDYPGNSIDASSGKVSISGLASPDTPFASSGTLATLNITVPQTAPIGTTALTFDFTAGQTTDSNVVERGTIIDLLSSVTNGSYNIGTGACTSGGGSATPAPTPNVSLISNPPGGAPIVDLNNNGIDDSSESAVKKNLPDAGITETTTLIAVVGGFLTVLGIIGLALL